MPSADSCVGIRKPYDFLSHEFETSTQVSRGKPIDLPHTPAEFTFLTLDGCGLRNHVLTRPVRPASYYPVSVRQVMSLLRASFRPRLAAIALALR